MCPISRLDGVENCKFLILPGLELPPLGHLASNQSPCRLRYHGSWIWCVIKIGSDKLKQTNYGYDCERSWIWVSAARLAQMGSDAQNFNWDPRLPLSRVFLSTVMNFKVLKEGAWLANRFSASQGWVCAWELIWSAWSEVITAQLIKL
jgi:hypothetical protein